MPDRTKKKQPGLSLYDLTPTELESFFLSIGEKPYRARQVLDFLYRHPVERFDEMTTLSKELRDRLSETVRLAPITLRATVESEDGTIKHGYEVSDPARNKIYLESVWMPADNTDVGDSDYGGGQVQPDRIALCISSQLGCAAGCTFCATGMAGLKGQLTTGEIIYQVVHARKLYGKLPDSVLFMGMGEPMHNYEAVVSAIEILTSEAGMALSPRRIVVSTCGEIEKLREFRAKFPKVRIAISLNAASDTLRTS
ncbi:MAG: radical SAM protein [bacterium]|nr:radical SAM protein [bacterium]